MSTARCGDHRCEQRRLRHGELRDRRAEVRLRSGTDPVGTFAEVDRRQVVVEDRLFALGARSSWPARIASRILRPIVRSPVVNAFFTYWLRDGRTALHRATVLEVVPQRAQRATHVDAAVVVEVLVFGETTASLTTCGMSDARP